MERSALEVLWLAIDDIVRCGGNPERVLLSPRRYSELHDFVSHFVSQTQLMVVGSQGGFRIRGAGWAVLVAVDPSVPAGAAWIEGGEVAARREIKLPFVVLS